jgi:hypothetical protein
MIEPVEQAEDDQSGDAQDDRGQRNTREVGTSISVGAYRVS